MEATIEKAPGPTILLITDEYPPAQVRDYYV